LPDCPSNFLAAARTTDGVLVRELLIVWLAVRVAEAVCRRTDNKRMATRGNECSSSSEREETGAANPSPPPPASRYQTLPLTWLELDVRLLLAVSEPVALLVAVEDAVWEGEGDAHTCA